MDGLWLSTVGFVTAVFVGLPTLLVVMAWITRDKAAIATDLPSEISVLGHAARARVARQAKPSSLPAAAPKPAVL